MMSFIIGLVALGIVIFSLSTISGLLQQWYYNYLANKKTDSTPYESRAEPKINKRHSVSFAASINTIADTFDAYKKEQGRHERQRALREKIVISVGIITALSAGASAWIFYGQLSAMQEDQRPWVAPSIPPKADVTYLWNTEFHQANVSTTLVIHNWGKSPALNVRRHVLAMVDERPVGWLPYDYVCRMAEPGEAIGISLFPTAQNISASETVTSQTHDRINTPIHYIFLIGCINYIDTLKKPHRTIFCFVSAAKGDHPGNGVETLASFFACDKYNDAD
jgi:hypothetical protein